MAHLSLKGLYKRYSPEVIAVKDFNLEVKDGEFIVLVGPSGCGKSTTLRMIAGLEEISDGEMHIDGRLVNNVPPKDRDLAMVFQNYALYPHMSVYENMAFGLRLRKMPDAEIDQRVREAAKILGIDEYLERKPKALSGGQRQRVAMGRAIVRKPKIFLFDEPLSNLDAKLRVQMRAEIARLHRRLNATSIYVTHDQIEAMTLADRIVVMKGGVVQQVGAPLELYRQPANRFVGGFIGSPSMNFLKAKVQGDRLVGQGVELPLKAPLPTQVEQGREVEVGIRPESVRAAGHGVGTIRGKVEVRELLGAEVYVHLSVEGQTFVGRFTPELAPQEGESITLSVELEGCHLFDLATEKAIR
ncbi:MAG: ABC transporter ATP-binding protein [Myxococcota bacterium]